VSASRTRTLELIEAADAAYRRARMLVYDVLPVGEPVVMASLSSAQRDALLDLDIAEAHLADHRRQRYDSRRPTVVPVSIDATTVETRSVAARAPSRFHAV
jgi:hypothetical protein